MVGKHQNFWLVTVMAVCGLSLVMHQRIAQSGSARYASSMPGDRTVDPALFLQLCGQLDMERELADLLPTELLVSAEASAATDRPSPVLAMGGAAR